MCWKKKLTNAKKNMFIPELAYLKLEALKNN